MSPFKIGQSQAKEASIIYRAVFVGLGLIV